MFCKRCGSQIADEAKFCPRCGENLLDNGTAARTADMSAVKNAFYKYKYVIIAVAVTIFGVIIGTMIVNAYKKNVEEKEADEKAERLKISSEKAEEAYFTISDYLYDYLEENDVYFGDFSFETRFYYEENDYAGYIIDYDTDFSTYMKLGDFVDDVSGEVYSEFKDEYIEGYYDTIEVEVEGDNVVSVRLEIDDFATQYPDPPENVSAAKRLLEEHMDDTEI